MISYEEALDLVLGNIRPGGSEVVDILDADNRFLCEDIYAPFDMPRFHNSSMDGYAIRSSDTIGATRKRPAVLKLAGEVKTGLEFKKILKRGDAFAISTGSKIPAGSDAVVMKEEVELKDGFIKVFRRIKEGENIRWKGEDFRKGERIIRAGTSITPQVKAVIAAIGKRSIKVFKSPSVTFISSGTELVEPGRPIKDFQIYNSNYYSIGALLKKVGISIKSHTIVRDDREEITRVLRDAIKSSDLLLISGGVSVGNVDYVKDSLKEIGVREIFFRARIKPGKPIFFGVKDRKVVFGLPGNPVSSFVNTILFVIPAIKKMSGSCDFRNVEIEAILENEIVKDSDRKEFFRGVYTIKEGKYYVRAFEKQGSHILSSLADSNCLIVTAYEPARYRRGDRVCIIPI